MNNKTESNRFDFNNLVIEPFNKNHSVESFDCFSGFVEDKDLNDFIKNDALNQKYDGWNQTHVLVEKGKNEVIGFFAICNDSFFVKNIVKKAKNKPYPQIPATKIARIAVDKKFQGKGIGTFLVKYAIGFVIDQIAKNSGCRYITLDSYQQRAEWYKKEFGFVENTIINEKLTPTQTINLILDLKNYHQKLKQK